MKWLAIATLNATETILERKQPMTNTKYSKAQGRGIMTNTNVLSVSMLASVSGGGQSGSMSPMSYPHNKNALQYPHGRT
jgi:hypothetical protein